LVITEISGVAHTGLFSAPFFISFSLVYFEVESSELNAGLLE
jgi:hypothetical protein